MKNHSKASHHRSQILSENQTHRSIEKPTIGKTHVFGSPSDSACHDPNPSCDSESDWHANTKPVPDINTNQLKGV